MFKKIGHEQSGGHFIKSQEISAVILLPAHPAFFTHTFVSGMQSFYFSESQDAMVLQTCHEKIVFWTHKVAVGLIDMENNESQDP